MFERIRDGIVNFITSRTSVLTILFIVMAGVLIQRIFELQIVNGETYQNEFSLQIRKERSIASSRGNIYDRNGKLLAYNDLAYSVTIEDVYEPYLLKNGFLQRTPRGRVASEKAYAHLGISPENEEK